MLMDLLFGSPGHPAQPALYFAIVVVIIGSIVLHELGHALTATWQRDPTPRMSGHLTWNPVVHMGWISLLLVAFMGIGWGRTPTTPRYFRHRRWGAVLVSFAGPLVNLLLAVIAAAALSGSQHAGASAIVLQFWSLVLEFNVLLFLLNMMPFPPLDGFGVLDGLFDLGDMGVLLRRAGMLGLVVAILVVNSDPFRRFAAVITVSIGRAFGVEFS